MPPPSLQLSTPPPSPRPSLRGLVNVKLPLPLPTHQPQRPHLTLTNPHTRTISPYHSSWPPPPSYEDWHPTTVIIEYQHQRGFPISEQTRALCGVFNRTTEREGFNYAGKKVGGGWMWKGHLDRVEWLYWYWEEGTRMRKVRLRVLEEERGMRGEVEGWGNEEKGEKDGGVVKEENGDGLSDEEREMVERLEAEMEEEEQVASEVKLDMKSEIDEEPKPKIQEEMTVEDMIKEGLTDTATWAAKIGDVDEWWKSLKRKRESDPGGSSI